MKHSSHSSACPVCLNEGEQWNWLNLVLYKLTTILLQHNDLDTIAFQHLIFSALCSSRDTSVLSDRTVSVLSTVAILYGNVSDH